MRVIEPFADMENNLRQRKAPKDDKKAEEISKRAPTWPSPLSQCCLCQTMLVVQPVACPGCHRKLGCATVNGHGKEDEVVIPGSHITTAGPPKSKLTILLLCVLVVVVVITMSGLFMMAVSHLNLGAISAGIRDVKDFFVYASLGTDDQYIGYELSKGEVLDVLDDPGTAEEFNAKYGMTRKPVVIRCRDGIDARFGWKTAKWNLDYLVEKVGDTHVQIETPANPLDNGTMHGVLPDMLNMSFKAYVRELQEPLSKDTRSMYLNLQKDARETVFSTPLPKLSDEIWVPTFINTRAVHDVNMWLGRSKYKNGTRSRMHVDGSDNLYILLKGRKRLRIFAPSQVNFLDTFGAPITVEPQGNVRFGRFAPIAATATFMELVSAWISTIVPNPMDAGPHFSRINSAYVNPDTNPTYKDAVSTVVNLSPGDMLWMPAGWFHEVTSFDVHLALNFWVAPPQFGKNH